MTEDSSSVSADRRIGFVGLGAMGAHMVARLLDAGHELAVFDTRTEAMEPHVAEIKKDELLMVMRTQLGAVYRADSRDGGRTGERGRGGNRMVPAPSRRAADVPGAAAPAGVSARLHVDVHLAQLVAVSACVVPAEEEFSTGGQDSTDLGSRAAAVTAVGGGQLGPGKGSRLHSGLPPSRHRVCPVSLDATNRLRGTSTLADARHPGDCSRRASRHPSRRDRVEVRPLSEDRPGRSGLRIQLTTGK